MGELLVLVVVGAMVWLLLKFIGIIFHVTLGALALPFQLLAIVGAILLAAVLIIPVALLAGILSLVIAPFLLLAPLLPLILIAVGLILLLKSH